MKTEPTEALKILDETRLNPIHEIPRYKAELAAKIAFQEGQSNPKIKQLEWFRYNSYGREISETPIGNFYVDSPNVGKIRVDLVEAFCGYFDSVDEAKLAAQRIFERRVKECLE